MKAVVKETFDPAVLNTVESMNLGEARTLCLSLVDKTNTKSNKKAALIRDLNAAPSSKELSRIMWNILLAGEGLSTTNSKWQATYG